MLAPMKLAAALENPFDLLAPTYAQRAFFCIVVLALLSAAVGWAIVLRDLPFFTHAVGSGAYPALVLGVVSGVSAAVAALAGAVAFAALLALASGIGTARAATSDARRRDALVGLAVVAALAAGSVIASIAGSGDARLAVAPESLLFGSVLTVDPATLMTLVAVALVAVACSIALFDRWLAGGFDSSVSGHLGSRRADLALLGCVALAAGAALPVTGALLAGAMLIVPAATARILTDRARRMPILTLFVALVYGTSGLYLSLALDLPTGAAIAAVAGAGFLLAALARVLARGSLRRGPVPALAATLLCALAVVGCGGGAADEAPEDQPLKVVATTPQVADIVKQVGGEAVAVTTMLPAGSDPHDYEPKPSAIAALSEADVVFRSGGDIDSWLDPAVKSAAPKNPPVDLSRSVVLLSEGGEDSDRFNAHWYLAPENVARAAQRVRDELVKADPAARETFRANANEYLDEIESVERKLSSCASRVPEDDRRLLSGHDDFNYLADAFGFTIAAQIAETGEAQPSASDLQSAVDAARAAKTRALVASSGEVSQLERQVAAKLGIPLLQLYADNLTTGDDASTLLGAIGYDVGRIAAAVTDGAVTCPPTQ